MEDLADHTLLELSRFFEDYKKLQHKEVLIKHLLGRSEAYDILEKGFEMYRDKFGDSLKQKS
jgi:inorganic pyrophosphatase